MTTPQREALLPCRPAKTGSKPRHGHAKHSGESPTYKTLQAMLGRCRYSNRQNSNRYKNRGISVCARWNVFELFLQDMGERPAGTSIDRIDTSRGYEPGNCRWSTPTEQSRNRRNAKLTFETAVLVAMERLDGIPAKEIAAKYGCSESLPREIASGRTWKDALAEAKNRRGEK